MRSRTSSARSFSCPQAASESWHRACPGGRLPRASEYRLPVSTNRPGIFKVQFRAKRAVLEIRVCAVLDKIKCAILKLKYRSAIIQTQRLLRLETYAPEK